MFSKYCQLTFKPLFHFIEQYNCGIDRSALMIVIYDSVVVNNDLIFQSGTPLEHKQCLPRQVGKKQSCNIIQVLLKNPLLNSYEQLIHRIMFFVICFLLSINNPKVRQKLLSKWSQDFTSGLVVKGDDSCSKCRGFESLCHILDGHLGIFSL